MNFVKSILTRDNIALFLSICGALGSLLLFIRTRILEKVDIDVKIPGICKPEMGSLIAYFTFANNSRLPVSITGISIVCGEDLYPCENISDYIINVTYSSGD